MLRILSPTSLFGDRCGVFGDRCGDCAEWVDFCGLCCVSDDVSRQYLKESYLSRTLATGTLCSRSYRHSSYQIRSLSTFMNRCPPGSSPPAIQSSALRSSRPIVFPSSRPPVLKSYSPQVLQSSSLPVYQSNSPPTLQSSRPSDLPRRW